MISFCFLWKKNRQHAKIELFSDSFPFFLAIDQKLFEKINMMIIFVLFCFCTLHNFSKSFFRQMNFKTINGNYNMTCIFEAVNFKSVKKPVFPYFETANCYCFC